MIRQLVTKVRIELWNDSELVLAKGSNVAALSKQTALESRCRRVRRGIIDDGASVDRNGLSSATNGHSHHRIECPESACDFVGPSRVKAVESVSCTKAIGDVEGPRSTSVCAYKVLGNRYAFFQLQVSPTEDCFGATAEVLWASTEQPLATSLVTTT